MPQRTLIDQMLGNWNIDNSPATFMADMWQRLFSPYQINPFNFNPLRDALSAMLDINAIRASDEVKVFVAATNVETGRARIFTREDLSLDALMASACLPFTFQAVVIDGHPYWDGGYAGNPPIFPLIYNCDSPDVVLVQINPLTRPGTPDTPLEIMNRLNEISFNSSMLNEMRAIAFVQKLVDQDHLKNDSAGRLKRMNMHVIADEPEMVKLGSASKANTDQNFLLFLKNMGRRTADIWLQQNWDKIGVESSVDLKTTYLD
jgi:NTE family protein